MHIKVFSLVATNGKIDGQADFDAKKDPKNEERLDGTIHFDLLDNS